MLLTVLRLFGLSANPVLISTAVERTGRAPIFGSGLGLAAFHAGTAVGTALGGLALATPLGVSGPVATGAVLSLVTLVRALLLARHAEPVGQEAGGTAAGAQHLVRSRSA